MPRYLYTVGKSTELCSGWWSGVAGEEDFHHRAQQTLSGEQLISLELRKMFKTKIQPR